MNIIRDAFGKKSHKKSSQESDATSITLDYPQESESVSSDRYTFRISAGPALKNVEVSINGDSWQRCRQSGAHWWSDWQGYQAGPKLVLARGVTDTGEKFVSRRRQFTVKFK